MGIAEKKTADLISELSSVQLRIDQLIKRRDVVDGLLKTEERKSEAIKEARIINKGVPKKVSHVRSILLKKMEQSKKESITIAKKKELDADIERLKKEIGEICSHPLVFYKDGYGGSLSRDYENGYPAKRYCVVCGLSEEAKDFRQNGRADLLGSVFETMKDSEERIVHREPYHPENLSRVNIWIPLGAVLKPFEESVTRTLNF